MPPLTPAFPVAGAASAGAGCSTDGEAGSDPEVDNWGDVCSGAGSGLAGGVSPAWPASCDGAGDAALSAGAGAVSALGVSAAGSLDGAGTTVELSWPVTGGCGDGWTGAGSTVVSVEAVGSPPICWPRTLSRIEEKRSGS